MSISENYWKQKGTVQEYYKSFVPLFQNVVLNAPYVIEIFTFGLQPEIGNFVNVIKPKTLQDAYYMAKMQETTNNLMNDSRSLFVRKEEAISLDRKQETNYVHKVFDEMPNRNGNDFQELIGSDKSKENEKVVDLSDNDTHELDISYERVENKHDNFSKMFVEEGVNHARDTLVGSLFDENVDEDFKSSVYNDPKLVQNGNETKVLMCDMTQISDLMSLQSGSALAQVLDQIGDECTNVNNVPCLKATFEVVQDLTDDLISADHDISNDGFTDTVLEMAFAENCGARIRLTSQERSIFETLYSEELSFVLEIAKFDTFEWKPGWSTRTCRKLYKRKKFGRFCYKQGLLRSRIFKGDVRDIIGNYRGLATTVVIIRKKGVEVGVSDDKNEGCGQGAAIQKADVGDMFNSSAVQKFKMQCC